ncbi:hypothetical protein UPYG_G00341440 [Umbra pygmaea]|uniref:Uncharacterized protein n=1 Tax=Umbra pygmaea TaxID=75934 RepID=A0ABD0W1E2_UMBPY
MNRDQAPKSIPSDGGMKKFFEKHGINRADRSREARPVNHVTVLSVLSESGKETAGYQTLNLVSGVIPL